MPETLIKCPSGLVGTIRNMKGAEFDALGDAAGMKSGASFDRILANCWVSTEDVGRAYTEEALSPRPKWSKMLSADRFYALLMIRALTWGPRYSYKVMCPACGEWNTGEVDLRDLEVVEIPDESCANFRAGQNRFDVWLPDSSGLAPPEGYAPALRAMEAWNALDERDRFGRSDPSKGWAVAVKLLDGEGEVRGAKDARKNPNKRVTFSLMQRIAGFNQAELGSDPKAVERFLERLDGQPLYDLRDMAEEFDGGVETALEDFICKACGADGDDEVELPFDRAFWMPRSRPGKPKRVKRRKRR